MINEAAKDNYGLGQHPCARFQNGEVLSFREAMKVLVDQQIFELRLDRKLSQVYDLPASSNLPQESVDRVKRVAAKALQIYEDGIAKIVAELEALEGEDVIYKDIADGLKSDDYSHLSI